MNDYSNDELEITVTLKSGQTTFPILGSNETGSFDAVGGSSDAELLLTSNNSDGGFVANPATGAAVPNLVYNLSKIGMAKLWCFLLDD